MTEIQKGQAPSNFPLINDIGGGKLRGKEAKDKCLKGGINV